MVRYDITPGYGRVRTVPHDGEGIEFIVGVSTNPQRVGVKLSEQQRAEDDIEDIFSIMIRNPATARTYAKFFNDIAETLEYCRKAI